MIPRPICRFDDQLMVAAVAVPGGCMCYPDDRQQFLCAQHFDRMSPIDGADLLWLDPQVEHWFT